MLGELAVDLKLNTMLNYYSKKRIKSKMFSGKGK